MSGTALATAGRILWRMLEYRGIDPATLFKEAGLDPEILDDPQARYPWNEASNAWLMASELLDDPAFGLTIAQAWRPSDFHALGCAFMASTTLRDALNRLVRYNNIVYDVISYSLSEHNGLAVLSYNPVSSKFEEPAILEDTRWAIILDACRRIYGADLDPLEVTFIHTVPSSKKDKFTEYFHCPLRFGQEIARMTFSTEVIDKRLPASNRELALTLDKTLSEYVIKLHRGDIVSRVKLNISEYLSSGHINNQLIADTLHLSPRSLQRKLAAAGTTFSKLVEAVRNELAESYLADKNLTLVEISYMLGFSSQSSFSRAFKRWSGVTPQDFRDAILLHH